MHPPQGAGSSATWRAQRAVILLRLVHGARLMRRPQIIEIIRPTAVESPNMLDNPPLPHPYRSCRTGSALPGHSPPVTLVQWMAEQADEDWLIVTLPVLRSSAAFSGWTIGPMQDS